MLNTWWGFHIVSHVFIDGVAAEDVRLSRIPCLLLYCSRNKDNVIRWKVPDPGQRLVERDSSASHQSNGMTDTLRLQTKWNGHGEVLLLRWSSTTRSGLSRLKSLNSKHSQGRSLIQCHHVWSSKQCIFSISRIRSWYYKNTKCVTDIDWFGAKCRTWFHVMHFAVWHFLKRQSATQ